MLRLVIAIETDDDVAREWGHLASGGAFARGAVAECNVACVVVLVDRHRRELELGGRTVWAGDAGVGVQLDGFDAALRARLEAWLREEVTGGGAAGVSPDASGTTTVAAAAEDPDGPTDAPDDDDDDERDPAKRNVYERLRNLPMAQQLKLAREGELAERIALERLYGKTVWEALLRNPRITPPEVARLARMGQLPRPLLDLIVGTAAWLRAPEVRRALLANIRLSADLVGRVLRLLPKHELKLVISQTAYPQAVRNTARALLKET